MCQEPRQLKLIFRLIRCSQDTFFVLLVAVLEYLLSTIVKVLIPLYLIHDYFN